MGKIIIICYIASLFYLLFSIALFHFKDDKETEIMFAFSILKCMGTFFAGTYLLLYY